MKLLALVVGALLIALIDPGVLAQAPIVTIPGLGDVQGDEKLSFTLDRTFYRYRGLPFAAPPIGSLRFQAPQPAAPWAGVFDGTKLGQRCPQLGAAKLNGHHLKIMGVEDSDDLDERIGEGPEDCLYLSIYTPRPELGANLPVMVFYHGGAFLVGSGKFYDGFRFMDHDVVLVVPHYRLGPLGFLCLHTDDIPGNAGLLDQVAALQWVKDNIAPFGGDPSRITVFGESAGAVSTSLLALSPLSTDLFDQYIAQSGTGLAAWAIEDDPVTPATELARYINCSGFDIPTMTNCYQQVDAMELIKAFNDFLKDYMAAGNSDPAGSGPVVQQAGAVRFIEQYPIEILNSGNYRPKTALIGSNKHEGSLVVDGMYWNYVIPNGYDQIEDYFKRNFTNYILDYFGVANVGDSMAAAVEKAHMGLENMGNITAMLGGLVDLTGNLFMKGPVYFETQENAKVAPTYSYAYSFLGNNSLWPFMGHTNSIPGGVCHADELILQFDIPLMFLTAREKAMSRKIVQLWINFAIYGEPNPTANPVEGVPTWLPVDVTTDHYMRLDETFTLMSDFTINEYFIATDDEQSPWV